MLGRYGKAVMKFDGQKNDLLLKLLTFRKNGVGVVAAAYFIPNTRLQTKIEEFFQP